MSTPPPAPVRGAVGVWYALAAFGLVNVAYLWSQRDTLTEAAAKSGFGSDAVTSLLVQLTIVAVVVGVGYAVFARLLRRGVRWSRGAISSVAALHALWVVLSGAGPANIVVLLLIAGGLAFTWVRGTAEWVRQHQ
ncbi:hypothetical protein [Actinosynnema sp. NPDC020468]|uniref:hypothetical protein n=1 Tax=Actinosynnema sp. NPDC020468 TaxID=3154488 RepID=UPI00340B3A70